MNKREADYLEELVAFPSVSADKKASKACAEFCAGFFDAAGLHTTYLESNGYPNVVATSHKTKRPKVLLQCHMDVVPAEPQLFKMRRAGGKLMGRGTFDMKFACASYMKLVQELGTDIAKYDFGIMLSFDEEIGGHNGVEALMDKGYGAQICILPDSGKDWHLESSAHGAWFLKLTKKGKNAHASIPKNGVNAAEILSVAISQITEVRNKYSEDELACSLTRFNSGTAINQIPDFAEAVFDIRFLNDSVRNRLKKQIEAICSKHIVEMKTIELAACVTASDAPGVSDFVKIAEEVLGRKINTGHSQGSTDARYFYTKGIPCVVIQPDGGGRHSDDEWVDEKGMEDLTRILRRYLEGYAIL